MSWIEWACVVMISTGMGWAVRVWKRRSRKPATDPLTGPFTMAVPIKDEPPAPGSSLDWGQS